MKVLFWIVFAGLFTYQAFEQARVWGWESLGNDARCYWDEVHGTETNKDILQYRMASPEMRGATGYIYGKVWRWAFYPIARPLASKEFCGVFTGAMIAVYIFLCWRVVNEVKGGWALVLLVTRYCEMSVVSGNVAPVLALALAYPVGVVLAPAVKLHLAPVAIVSALGQYYRRGREGSRYGHGYADLPVADRARVEVGEEVRYGHLCGVCGTVHPELSCRETPTLVSPGRML